MAKKFDFRKRVNGTIETFYPKTSTDNVVKETANGDKSLDAILDEMGGFKQYSEEVVNETNDNDLLFEVLGDVVGSEEIKSIAGTIVSNTPPEITNYIWVDKSTDVATLKYYNTESETWKPITLGSSGGNTDSDTYIELDSDIEE